MKNVQRCSFSHSTEHGSIISFGHGQGYACGNMNPTNKKKVTLLRNYVQDKNVRASLYLIILCKVVYSQGWPSCLKVVSATSGYVHYYETILPRFANYMCELQANTFGGQVFVSIQEMPQFFGGQYIRR